MITGASLIALLFGLILIGVPVYVSLGFAGAVGLLVISMGQTFGDPFIAIPQSLYSGIGFFPLLAIPLFILAGEIMNRSGITDRLVKFSVMLIGRWPASLANANILASMFFGGITGSAQADTSAVGGVLIPAMEKEGYSKEIAVAVTASSSTVGPIIPPSIMMVIYGVSVGTSIGALFIAGVLPGILIGLSLIATVLVLDRKHKFPRRTESIPMREKLTITKDAMWPLVMPGIIVGGILGGVVTPTEAGALAVLYALIFGYGIQRSLQVADLPAMLRRTAILTAAVMLIISCAKILSYALTVFQMPVLIGAFFQSISESPIVFLLLVNILLLLIGTFMDGGASLIILSPILAPIAVSYGIDPVHFGVIMVLNLIIGQGTPPLGLCLFIASAIAKLPVERGAKAILPFIGAEVAVLFVVTYFPWLALALPAYFGFVA
ncbi:C4-dicarboxylate transporter DctM subunit [Rhodobium orientis]|uniref:TRAP transporter large permease protein n=1 Tax=Rhodobium orientis TaxID=34017 RepID=A0A327JRK3_9HYPH|nr:TRAP transporter large permease [Rhodobium orientis]MBB4304572.1 C4-dicarboxylate transporter DctM subunit [Rhodobium orientis]MBK5951393.1 C4-dicarboxylate ABC transporter [Rhodobium orientis]RAI27532.1 C4-dicarboxylate ABC transporter [Rhodobium orientis]